MEVEEFGRRAPTTIIEALIGDELMSSEAKEKN